MSAPISAFFGSTIPHGRIDECIEGLEGALKFVNETNYHSVIGKSFLHHASEVANVMVDFFENSKEKGGIKAIYFEMNGFSINPDRWFCNGFGCINGGTLWDLTWDLDWASNWDYVTKDITLTGMEDVQIAFGKLYRNKKVALGIRVAEDIVEHLVVARFCETIKAAHQIAKLTFKELDGLPILATAHDWDIASPSI